MAITVSFTLSRAEYAAGTRAELTPIIRVAALAGVVLLAAGIAAKLVLLTGLGTLAVVVAAAVWFLPWWRWAGDPSLHAEEHWTIDDDGCTLERRAAKSRFEWDHYRGLLDVGPVFVLVGDRGATDIVPKRALDEDTEDAFFELVSAHVAVRDTNEPAESRGGWTD